MKKMLGALTALALILTLVSCGETENGTEAESTAASVTETASESSAEETKAEGNGKFMVGYGQVNITPNESVPMAGYGNTDQRMSEGLYSYLYTTCTAFTDANGTTMLIFANDLINSNWTYYEAFQKAVSEAHGIQADHILFTCSHTHSGPDLP